MKEDQRVIGSRARRIEDLALLRGEARFVDDVPMPGALHAAFVRSPFAHARMGRIDFSAAAALPGVVACFDAAALAPLLARPRLPLAFPAGQVPEAAMPYVLAAGETCHVGEALALVVAQTRHIAEDAAALVEIDYEELPALIDSRAALEPGAPLPCTAEPIHLFKRFDVGYGDCDAAFAGAHDVVRLSLRQHRGQAHPMETRGILANPDAATGTLTVWASTQMSHELAHTLCMMLGLPETGVRVIAPQVGGAFGAKYLVYPEDVAVAAAAHRLRRPVKWIEDRREHFLAAIQEREQYWTLEAAIDAQGRLLAVRGQLVHDQGAYAPHAINVPFNAATSFPGPYVLPAYRLDVAVARTNKVAVIPIRGAGYPQGCFAMERLLDRIAERVGIDRGEVRLRNYVPAAAMPYTTPMATRAGAPVIYDSGDYAACHARALQAADLPGFRARQAAAREQGRRLGIGYAAALKGTGRGPFESGTVRVAWDGRVQVFTGALAMGQGLATALAQICADALGLDLGRIDVSCGDTAHVSLGMGGFASRQTVTAGSSVHLAARAVRDKALRVAAGILGQPAGTLALQGGHVYAEGGEGPALSLADIAQRLRGLPGYAFPEGVEAGLEATFHFRIDRLAYANAFHVCEVEVDDETGMVRVLRYLALQDSGRLVNPRLVEGQIHGSVAHGIGNALLEHMRYDGQGQPLTTTFADYLLPTATDVPPIDVLLHETPSPLNPLGVKGAGECSVLPVGAAIAAAIEDALADVGAKVEELPISPARLLELIRQAGADGTRNGA
ncbi:xanthine dehydrogenase family protein molybdopterin-binding subunit [Pigmentiphaga soli]|uniref:Xanthine dehydrogenase family protein molybdopterin-binding subunit n=1 Tax=Pigmentiphaga soli TaxID=1007095 RepID=A0ABP8HTL7_9BURK